MKITTWRVMGAALMLAGSVSAHAGILSPDGRICKDPLYISQTVQAFGFASTLQGRPAIAHFTVKTSDNFNGPYDDVSVTDGSSFYFAPVFVTPKWYKVCARNMNAFNINVTLGLQGY